MTRPIHCRQDLLSIQPHFTFVEMRTLRLAYVGLLLTATSQDVSSLTIPLVGRQHGPLPKPIAPARRLKHALWRYDSKASSIMDFDLQLSKSRAMKALTLKASNNQMEDPEVDFRTKDDVIGPLILLLFSQFILFIGVGAVIPSIPLYGKELGFSSAANGIVISIPSVALVILSKFGGNYADKARKPAMIIGMVTIAISDLGTSVATGLPMLLLARLGLGAGRCISESGERGMLADLANRIPEFRGRALAAQQACLALGIAIGAPIGGLIVEEYGPRSAFLCVTLAATIVLFLYCFLPETQESNSFVSGNWKKIEQTEPDVATEHDNDWLCLLTQNEWRGLALCQSGASFGFAAKIASIPLLAATTLPGGAAAAGGLLSVAGLSGLIGAPIGGFLTDRVGAKVAAVLSGCWSAFALILIPVALAITFDDDLAITVGAITLDANNIAFCSAVVAWSMGAAAQSPALVALAQEKAPRGREASALAMPKAFGDGTYIVVPFILGLVSDAFAGISGIECAVAGTATLFGAMALGLLIDEDKIQSRARASM